MSQQTVYIRESDMDKWKALEKKSEFIHLALNSKQQEPINYVKESAGTLCKHGMDPKFCKFAKPGKPCK